jgi:PHD/YefM family antitoxin component YafN of YafNO toxin-antitoxin module
MMQTISAREIKRRGIGVVDEALAQGPVHVIRNDEPRYVILDEARYRELLEDAEEAYLARVRESLDDVRAGRVRRVSIEELAQQLEIEDVDAEGCMS